MGNYKKINMYNLGMFINYYEIKCDKESKKLLNKYMCNCIDKYCICMI